MWKNLVYYLALLSLVVHWHAPRKKKKKKKVKKNMSEKETTVKKVSKWENLVFDLVYEDSFDNKDNMFTDQDVDEFFIALKDIDLVKDLFEAVGVNKYIIMFHGMVRGWQGAHPIARVMFQYKGEHYKKITDLLGELEFEEKDTNHWDFPYWAQLPKKYQEKTDDLRSNSKYKK